MGDASIWQWLVLLILVGPMLWATATILRRLGFSGWWCLALLIPFGNLVGLITSALVRWPIESRR
jgi:hypothetical protein